MATTTEQTIDTLRDAIEAALESGTPRSKIVAAVADTIAEAEARYSGMSVLPSNNGDNCLIFDELPVGLIDLPRAAVKYGCQVQRFRKWVDRGIIKSYGRLRAPARGGGYIVVAESELVAHLASPPNKGGRPPKDSYSQ